MSEPHAVWQVRLFDFESVGDDLIVIRRGNDELSPGLVIRMVYGWQPVPCLVRPVVTEERAVAVLVGADDQTCRRYAVVLDRKLDSLVCSGRHWQLYEEFVTGVRKPYPTPIRGNRRYDHALPLGVHADEIQPHFGDTVHAKP